ncbi:endonuclease/exonuclease/phosphatase family protein [Mangrovimonas sp. AS39]|uniref:endonuclease/exonuclease/phosphatase family protein n=1 Tax=Mangrovimonas futianensis TaxID=2895523 RepID=UPI001E575B57|nr:endonuclease/exonuclease/phosphatase family protein [Mangrovimonas futianensis]MCF1190556.1 endonuclease/exonuclease/phosphatase family protein [Mangrovimonas futianensis]MCF1193692.1 endonuclease/exonuclease/phosphatase family protein [Mangrovimonas futianensis]MCF1420657.1 endonuclease/exonuclease/phosphatase family protein [Mangrovimonas futianensis]
MKLHIILFYCLFLAIGTSQLNAQEKKTYKIHTIAFYNLENLFDTINDTSKFDEASPIMEMKGDIETVYKKKVHNMARVLSDIGLDDTHNSPVIIGISEVENRQVIEDLINDPLLLGRDYGIIHYDSPDARGIDVAMLYQKKFFTPLHTSSHELKIYDDNSRKRVYTRDQLLVSGTLEGDMIHVLVNHWPSRSGGEARSRPKRVAAAKLSKKIIDSLQTNDPYAKIFLMGDLNDDPTNESVKKVLNAEKDRDKVEFKGIYNPYESFYRKGLGTTAYRDAWSLFDQILISKPLLDKDFSTFKFYQAGIYNKNYLVGKYGRYKGYPLRSFADGGFTDGFSDHFPVYVYVIKEISE